MDVTVSGLLSARAIAADPPVIEDILERYSNIPNLSQLALGSCYFPPPEAAVTRVAALCCEPNNHRYGAIMGYEPLRARLRTRLSNHGLDMSSLELLVCGGANQGFINIALALCGEGQHAGGSPSRSLVMGIPARL